MTDDQQDLDELDRQERVKSLQASVQALQQVLGSADFEAIRQISDKQWQRAVKAEQKAAEQEKEADA
jgi:galactokinase/mevalonate kinase-like predicted kinase